MQQANSNKKFLSRIFLTKTMETIIIKYGGSFVIPNNKYDIESLEEIKQLVKEFPEKQFIFIIGGGKLARNITTVSKDILDDALENDEELKSIAFDELGIAITKINGRFVQKWLMKKIGKENVFEEIVDYPLIAPQTNKQVIIATGYKPGVSTDYDMMLLAKAYNASKVFKISNFEIVLNVKPEEFDKNKIKEYQQLPQMTWEEMLNLVGKEFIAGGNYPLDPPSAILGNEIIKTNPKFKLYIGQRTQLKKMIKGEDFIGTIVSK